MAVLSNKKACSLLFLEILLSLHVINEKFDPLFTFFHVVNKKSAHPARLFYPALLYYRDVARGEGRGSHPSRNLADRLTLFKPGDRLCPSHYCQPPPRIQKAIYTSVLDTWEYIVTRAVPSSSVDLVIFLGSSHNLWTLTTASYSSIKVYLQSCLSLDLHIAM